ncbi:hypothetical protein K788_0003802 [Paraburkholderia caribensis MBA4]|uniref:Uncharacterized protein n=1 Tax=Paraburkholderia caribensis MBA4 TaxID=1323664 RepID=A0A0P0RB05_9BURK|nr:hypothetical protein K788_0003802 [Paraburkholderia caribensis MBA4]
MDQTHGKSYRRKSELYAKPFGFRCANSQLAKFFNVFSHRTTVLFRFWVRLAFEPVSYARSNACAAGHPSRRVFPA